MKIDDPLIQLWGGPCDGEFRRFSPETDALFWAVPGFGENDKFYHEHRHWYRFDPIAGKARFQGVSFPYSGDATGFEPPKGGWE